MGARSRSPPRPARGWLLYSNSEDDLVAIDTAGAHRTIDLTNVGRRLPGARAGFTAYWSGQPPEL